MPWPNLTVRKWLTHLKSMISLEREIKLYLNKPNVTLV